MKLFKKTLLVILLLCPISLLAQTKFGYLSYTKVFEEMPEYASAKESMRILKEKYDAETQRSEEEFYKKFGEFLQGQKEFPANILQKRQREMQELMEKSLAFKEEARKVLTQAEKELQVPIMDKLNRIIAIVGRERHYAFVLNTDGHACPYVDSDLCEDATPFVLEKLK